MNNPLPGNKIPQEQLTTKSLDRLAAQRHLYANAKRVQAFQIILTVPVVVLLSILILFRRELEVYAAFYGVVITLLDFALFTPWQKGLKRKAARVQELFDCDVLSLDWRNLKAGRRPDAEAIMESSEAFRCKDPECSTLRDWYPPAVGTLPLGPARLVCQRASCWWDARLRRRYAAWVLWAVGGMTLVVFLLALVGGLTVNNFFLKVVAPMLPTFVLGYRQYTEQIEAAEAADKLKEHAEGVWDRAMSGGMTEQEMTKEARDLQDEIFEHRRQSPLIFEWIYKRLRDKDEARMNKGAQELIDQAKKEPGPTAGGRHV